MTVESREQDTIEDPQFWEPQLTPLERELLEALDKAVETIHAWHGDEAWDFYQMSPEMQIINGAIVKAARQERQATARELEAAQRERDFWLHEATERHKELHEERTKREEAERRLGEALALLEEAKWWLPMYRDIGTKRAVQELDAAIDAVLASATDISTKQEAGP